VHAFADSPASLIPRAPSCVSRKVREHLRQPRRSPLVAPPATSADGTPKCRPLWASPNQDPSPSSRLRDQERALLLPVWLSVFCHMLGVGITLSQLPLYLTALGASPAQLGLAISGFSIAQMLGCPLLVSISTRYGRLAVMRVCLAGNAAASLLTAWSSSWTQIAAARFLAGFFAASVPVSQAAVRCSSSTLHGM